MPLCMTYLHMYIRYDTIRYYTILYHTILYYAMLYYTMLYYAILYYIPGPGGYILYEAQRSDVGCDDAVAKPPGPRPTRPSRLY